MKFTTFLKHKLNVKFFYAVAHALHINWTYLSLLFELFWEIQPYIPCEKMFRCFPNKINKLAKKAVSLSSIHFIEIDLRN